MVRCIHKSYSNSLKDQLVNVLKPVLHLSGTLSEENLEQFKMLAINLDIRIDDDEVITD